MPNLYQLAFLASLFFTFSTLALTAHFINYKLAAAGYDFSRLILIGLPDQPPSDHPVLASMSYLVDIPLFGTLDLVAIATSPAFIFATLIIVGTAIYSNVLHTGWSLFYLSQLLPQLL